MKRILVFGMTENPGGVEAFLLNYYRRINKNRIQFDFLCNSHRPVAYEEELLALGGRTFHITARSQNFSMYRKELEAVFQAHASEWSAVWINVSSLANIDYLKIAKQYGITKRIIHSHNSRNMDSRLRGYLHKWNRTQIEKYATDFWACSDDAARWFYNKRLLKKAVLVHNAIDVDFFQFSKEKRDMLRREHSWDNQYIVGNIGRLHFQKNQSFMLDVFQLYHHRNPDSVLVLVGQGEDAEKLKAKVEEIGLSKAVYFAGVQNDIPTWLSCFDLFLFPSRFEGLSIAAMEAQANGLPVLASDNVIPKEVKMNENFVFYNLESGAAAWSTKMEQMKTLGRADYHQVKANFMQKGYDISTECARLEELLMD